MSFIRTSAPGLFIIAISGLLTWYLWVPSGNDLTDKRKKLGTDPGRAPFPLYFNGQSSQRACLDSRRHITFLYLYGRYRKELVAILILPRATSWRALQVMLNFFIFILRIIKSHITFLKEWGMSYNCACFGKDHSSCSERTHWKEVIKNWMPLS